MHADTYHADHACRVLDVLAAFAECSLRELDVSVHHKSHLLYDEV